MENQALIEIGIRQRTPETNSSQKSSRELTTQIIYLVEQCFACQDTYGLTPEQLKIRMKAMIEDLKHFPLETIQEAFVRWRRSSPKIPTPNNMISTCEKVISESRIKRLEGLKQWSDFNGDWQAYREYLQQNDAWLAGK